MGAGRIRMVIVGATVAAPLLLGVPSAMAANPNYYTTPAAGGPASPNSNDPPPEVCTYKAPPAEGGEAPGSTAAGGSPGYVLNQCRATGVQSP